MVNPSIRSAWDGVVLPPAGEAEGVIFQLIGYTIPAAASKRSALGATRPWLLKPVLYCLAGVSNTVVPVGVYGNLVANGLAWD